jgi:hypothetical protein
MSMFSSYIKRKIKKHGTKADDKMVAKIKKAMESFK